jgi:hypothetical protein
MMTYPIAGLAVAVVPEQIAAMGHQDVAYSRLAGQSGSLPSRIVAVHRPRVDPAFIRLLDLLTSPRSGQRNQRPHVVGDNVSDDDGD